MKAAKRSCELCEAPASVYCDADQASLCWNCDNGVHGVSFLVARHCRTLLCRTCNSLTEWRASGSELGRLVSACKQCYLGAENGAEDEDFDEIDVRDSGDFGDIDDEEDDRDNQVVPSIATELKISLKRKRGDASDLSSQIGLRQNISIKCGGASTTTEDCGFGEELGETETDSFRASKKNSNTTSDCSVVPDQTRPSGG